MFCAPLQVVAAIRVHGLIGLSPRVERAGALLVAAADDSEASRHHVPSRSSASADLMRCRKEQQRTPGERAGERRRPAARTAAWSARERTLVRGTCPASGGDRSMLHLELSEREADDTRTALSTRLVGMRDELVHTDDRAYRADLKATIERLEVVLGRLEAMVAAPAAAP
ncbi:hypothetical protein sce8088 [Sorangium cellulosum So ce56]|uniref:Uncharacterized protein n=2 Tax=Polyangiaceae TaxID=49 RepID=A9FHX4_SORC5|nr:hypothetical protein sce8088 [Sorangium cellulosum So ce56]